MGSQLSSRVLYDEIKSSGEGLGLGGGRGEEESGRSHFGGEEEEQETRSRGLVLGKENTEAPVPAAKGTFLNSCTSRRNDLTTELLRPLLLAFDLLEFRQFRLTREIFF